jgi:hypothetical protein
VAAQGETLKYPAQRDDMKLVWQGREYVWGMACFSRVRDIR